MTTNLKYGTIYLFFWIWDFTTTTFADTNVLQEPVTCVVYLVL